MHEFLLFSAMKIDGGEFYVNREKNYESSVEFGSTDRVAVN